MKKEDLMRLDTTVQEISPELHELAKNIFDNPELGDQEFKACAWQTELLAKYGFKIEQSFCDIPTAYKAVYDGKKTGPRIAMLAEYDALPVLGHACGHNIIATISVGSGIAMREFADIYGGQICVIGTPAEETNGSKVMMSAKGAFDEFDVVMMAHPAFKDAESINTMAMRCFAVEFFGKPAHAAAAPEAGVNALDAVINFFNLVNAMRQQTKPDARIHGIISEGGVAPNIIPEYTKALFYVRANKMAYVDILCEKVKKCAEGAALGTGCRVEFHPEEADFKDTCSNRYLSDLVVKELEGLGRKVMKNISVTTPGSSDLGDVSYCCPSVQLTCGISPKGDATHYSPHTEEFAQRAGSPVAVENALDFVKAFTMTAIRLMTEPEHLIAIKEEFKSVGQEEEGDSILPLS